MLAIVAALIVATLLCLAFDSTRWLGVVGVVLLFYLHPLLLVVLLVLAVVASLATYFYLRRSKNDVPRLRN